MARIGASRVFFDIQAIYRAGRLVQDVEAQQTLLSAVFLDSFDALMDGAAEVVEMMREFGNAALDSAKEFEQASIQFEKFGGLTEQKDEIIEIGEALGYTGDQALYAASRMAQVQSLFGAEATPIATEAGIQFGLIGGLQTEEAMTRLISLQEQTNFMFGETSREITNQMDAMTKMTVAAENTGKVLNQLNTIENRAASTMVELTDAMDRFAAQAHIAGESVHTMAAMSATLIEAGETSERAGTALNFVYSRLAANIAGARDEVIRLIGEENALRNGELRPLSELLPELNEAFADMGRQQRANSTYIIAGTRHFNKFTKLVMNSARFTELQTMAFLELDPAIDEVNKVLGTNTGMLQRLEAIAANLRIEFGERLLPTQVAVTQAQVNFLRILTDSEGHMGRASELLARFGMMSQLLAVPRDVFLTIQGTNVALGIQVAIMKQLAGQDVMLGTRADNLRKYGQQYHEVTNAVEELSHSVKEQQKTIDNHLVKQVDYRKELELLEMQTNELTAAERNRTSWLRKEITGTGMRAQSGQAMLDIDKEALETAKENREASIRRWEAESGLSRQHMKNHEMQTTRMKQEKLQMDKGAMAVMGLSTAFTSLGMATSMFADNAVAAEISTSLMTIGMGMAALQSLMLARNMLAQASAAMVLAAGNNAVLASLAKWGPYVALAAVGLGVIYNSVRKANSELEELTDNAASAQYALGSLSLTLEEFQNYELGGELISEMSMSQLEDALENTNKEIDKIKGSTEDLSGSNMSVLETLNEQLRVLYEQQRVIQDNMNIQRAGDPAFREQLEQQKDLVDMLSARNDAEEVALKYSKFGLSRMKSSISMLPFGFTKDAIPQQDRDALVTAFTAIYEQVADETSLLRTEAFAGMTEEEVSKALGLDAGWGDGIKGIEKYTNNATLMAKTILEVGEAASLASIGLDVTTHKMLENGMSIQEIIDSMAEGHQILNKEEPVWGGLSDSVDDATKSLMDFASARQELFYGGNRGRMNMSMMRQVVNTGVENLYNHVELIQTNNFNGLTPDEMVNTIVREIKKQFPGVLI